MAMESIQAPARRAIAPAVSVTATIAVGASVGLLAGSLGFAESGPNKSACSEATPTLHLLLTTP
jgi:hypothetical protein